MGRNPFEARLIKDFFIEDPCENLDVLFQDLKEVNRYSWHFNPWHHRVINYIVSLFARIPKNPWAEHDPYAYFGAERRSVVRGAVDDYFTHLRRSVVHAMMPKTKKIELLKDVA